MELIERQTVIDAVEKESQVDGAYGYMDTKSIVDLLNNLPNVNVIKEELKPCPFCGGEAEICSAFENKFLGKYWYVRCKSCYSRCSNAYESIRELKPNQEYEAIKGAWDQVIKAWNRRTSNDESGSN